METITWLSICFHACLKLHIKEKQIGTRTFIDSWFRVPDSISFILLEDSLIKSKEELFL